MTTDTTAAPRANSHGSPCPQWCTANHDEHPTHLSDPVVNDWPEPRVQVLQGGWLIGAESEVSVTAGGGCVILPAVAAAGLADVLEALEDLVRYEPSRLRAYADQIRAAAGIARETL